MRRMVWALLATVAVIGVLFLFVLPGTTLLSQQRSIRQTSNRIVILRQENAKLVLRASQLRSDSEIEQIARQEYGLVMPGQQAYAIIPSGPATTTTTAPAPTTSTTRP